MPKSKQKSTGRQSKTKTLKYLTKKLVKTSIFWKKRMGWRKDIPEGMAESIVLVSQLFPQSLTAMVIMSLLHENVEGPDRTNLTRARALLTEAESLPESILVDDLYPSLEWLEHYSGISPIDLIVD